MALELSLVMCKSEGCKLLTFTDDTGLYEATSNPHGWYGPNTDLNADVAGAFLIITDPSGDVYTIDIISDLGFDYPTAEVDLLEYEVPSTLLGLAATESFADGIYDVTYKIIDNADNEYTVSRKFAMMCTVWCDISNLLAMIPEQYNCNKCNKDFIHDVYDCYMLMKAAEHASYCGSQSEFENILATLKILITNVKYGL